jgi:hypothetical protein
MTCRIAEMTVLCAGHYADAYEFSAAGDLLVNPRKIFIHIKGHSKPLIKHRHAGISEQLNPAKIPRGVFLQWFRTNVILQADKKPLLTDLFDKLTESGRVASGFLAGMKTRMNRIADTISFLSAWQVACAEDLIERMRRETPETREFIHANLCHFSSGMFHFIGQEIRRINHDPAYRSPLLADPSDTWNP